MTHALFSVPFRWRHIAVRLLPLFTVALFIFSLFITHAAYGHAPTANMEQQSAFTCATVTEIPRNECEALVALYQSTNGSAWTGAADWLTTNQPCRWFGVVCQANQVIQIDLHSKRLIGELPAAIGQLSKLQHLDLFNNQLHGVIPDTLAELPLQNLNLGQNQLSGALPAALGKLITLQSLNVGDNPTLKGPLPVTLSNLGNLHTLLFANTELCEPTEESFQQWMAAIKRVQSSERQCGSDVGLLAVYFLAFDNNPEDVDINLTPHYRAVVEGLLAATQSATHKTVALVVDLDGVGDTHLVIIQQGAVERVLGVNNLNELLAQKFGGWSLAHAPETQLPDANGDLHTPSTFEYNMTDAASLGGVLRWLFNRYVVDANATRTLVSYIGHGAAAIPEVDVAATLGIAHCTSAPIYGVPSPAAGIVALPSSRGAHPAFTDCHGFFDASTGNYRPALLAPRSLARALQTAIAHTPVTQVDILDIFHCFALSLETLVEFAPAGVPVAGMVIGSPNYAFFAPEMVGSVVAEDDPTAAPPARAAAILNRYDAVLRAVLPTAEASTYYPRLFVAVEASQIQTLLDRWNAVVDLLLNAWADPAARPGVQQSLAAAYAAAGKYDTTYCKDDPAAQAWELKAPDALVDLAAFAQTLGASSSDVAVQNAAQALVTAVADAIGGRRIAVDGVPLGLHPTATTEWRFATYGGISLYTDLGRMNLPTLGASRSWQAFWYNNPSLAYSFTAQSQWDELLNLFWQADDPNGGVKKVFCLPELVMLPEEGGVGLALEAITAPPVQPLPIGQPVALAATIRAESATTRYTEVLFQVTMGNQTIFAETVVLTRLLAEGEGMLVTTNGAWTPASLGVATLTVIIDPNNRLIEENETNNTRMQDYTVTPVVAPPQDVILLSSTSGGRIGALSFADEDILAFEPATNRWSLFFDGSDVGLGKGDIDGLQLLPDGSLLLSLDKSLKLAGVGQIGDSDLLRFQPSKLGVATAGKFTFFFDGSDVGLTSDDEDIDAIALAPDGQWLFSTAGAAKVDQLTAQDEDLLRFTPTKLGDSTAGSWTLFFDGSDVGLNQKKDDIGGAAFDSAGLFYVSLTAGFALPSVSGNGSDILRCTPFTAGDNTVCTFSLFWDGAAHAFHGEVIDALFIGTLPAIAQPAQQSDRQSADANGQGLEVEEAQDEAEAADNEIETDDSEDAEDTEEDAEEETAEDANEQMETPVQSLYLPLIAKP